MVRPHPRTMANARRLVNSTLTDVATNSRTGLTRNVRVSDATRDEKIEGLPPFIKLRRWKLTFADGDGVRAGDMETVPGKGVYTIEVDASPTTISAGTTAYALMSRTAGGSPVWPIVTNASVTFRNPTAAPVNGHVTASVFLAPLSSQIQLTAEEAGAGYDSMVIFDGTLTYPDGSLIRVNHHIEGVGSGDISPSQVIPITKPRRYLSPIPYCIALFTSP